ncbi:MAG: metallophosphoesterase family protein [Nanoarchaeota archaeon]
MNKTEIIDIIKKAKNILSNEPQLIKLNNPNKDIIVIGDLHSDYESLDIIIKKYYNKENILVFVGDYVDRAVNLGDSIKTIIKILELKINDTQNIILLRGNHEFDIMNKKYGFHEEIKKLYDKSLIKNWSELFELLPLSFFIDNSIFIAHAGIPEVDNLDEINKIKKGLQYEQDILLDQLVWNDFSTEIEDKSNSLRGVKNSFIGGKTYFETKTRELGIKTFIRGHQPNLKGYTFNKKCITLQTCRKYKEYPKEEKEGLIAFKGVIIAKINKNKPGVEIIDILSNE